ncbi:MAG: hypothetical protein PVH88_01455 [Ignavibacteria bacterium]|jgi:flagellar motility protein MotE (MotC chaperone)
MKAAVYTMVFALAFLTTTVAIILMNEKFANIFAFNFSPNPENEPIMIVENNQGETFKANLKSYKKDVVEAVKAEVYDEIKEGVIDSLKQLPEKEKIDNLFKEVEQTKNIISDIKKKETEQKKLENTIANKEKEIENLKKQHKDDENEEYQNWIKSTVKLFETMDSKKAAKIISEYSDNVARDLIYKMKKKKAAEILSNLNTEKVIQLTQASE